MIGVRGTEVIIHQVAVRQHHALPAPGRTRGKQDHGALLRLRI